MQFKIVKLIAVAGVACLFSFCVKADKAKEVFIKIDNAGLNSEVVNAFSEMKNYYPTTTGEYFPGDRSDNTYMITAQFLSSEPKVKAIASSIKSSKNWEWKLRYFPGQIYLNQVLVGGLGSTNDEMKAYYQAHLSNYQEKTQQVTIDSTVKDTAKQRIVKDTVIQIPFERVSNDIRNLLFLKKYPVPDSLFMVKNANDSLKMDSSLVKDKWIQNVQRNAPNFFLERVFEDTYKKKLPDSLSEWYGKGKIITPEDMQIILSWLPEAQRANYTSPTGTVELARWLLKWKLFSNVAKKTGFADKQQVKDIIAWALKVEAAAEYVNKELVPKAKAKVTIDTAMCKYAYMDETGDINRTDVAGVNAVVDRSVSKAIKTNINSFLYDIRKHHKIVFLKPDPASTLDYKDELAGNPVSMIAKADSLRDAGNTGEAEALYESLVKNFSFTEQGLKAYPELAKIKTEKGESAEAIRLYREYVIANGDKGIRCNTFFMIGFIYDEYLNRSALAEVNYKWVLKNAPECELADDAEFMTLHLNEPMSSVEELRAEALRQGKKVDTTSVAEAPMDKAPAKK